MEKKKLSYVRPMLIMAASPFIPKGSCLGGSAAYAGMSGDYYARGCSYGLYEGPYSCMNNGSQDRSFEYVCQGGSSPGTANMCCSGIAVNAISNCSDGGEPNQNVHCSSGGTN